MAYFRSAIAFENRLTYLFKDASSGDKETTVFLWQELHFRMDGAPWKTRWNTHRYVFQGAASTNT
jgi:hypothetical protein